MKTNGYGSQKGRIKVFKELYSILNGRYEIYVYENHHTDSLEELIANENKLRPFIIFKNVLCVMIELYPLSFLVT